MRIANPCIRGEALGAQLLVTEKLGPQTVLPLHRPPKGIQRGIMEHIAGREAADTWPSVGYLAYIVAPKRLEASLEVAGLYRPRRYGRRPRQRRDPAAATGMSATLLAIREAR